MVTIDAGIESNDLEEEEYDEPIESFDKIKLDSVSPIFKLKILALYTEIWHKYDIDNTNTLIESEFIKLMADIYERLEIPIDRDNIKAYF